MYRLNLLFLFNMCFLLSQLNAQKENNYWTFGYHNGLDFTSGVPVFFESKNVSVMGAASVSNASGELLFYSDGNDVWDATGTVMPNGSGIEGNGPTWQAAGGASQGVAIVNTIADINQYYLFVLDANGDINANYPGYLRYSVIDMALNGGKGDVVSNQKNIILDSFMSEQMTITKGVGCSYWLIAHKHNETKYLAFKIDAEGIHPVVTSNTGSLPSNVWGGEMKVSPDAKKIVRHSANSSFETVIELSEFDNVTGKVENTIFFNADPWNTKYGFEFSPDNSKLYVTNSLPSMMATYGNIVQFDISQFPNITAIEASEYEVVKTSSAYNGMRTSPDGKIYIAMPKMANIARINNPNAAGASCNYDPVALAQPSTAMFPVIGDPLYGFALGSAVLPVPSDTNIHPTIHTVVCINGDAAIRAEEGYSNYIWDDGTTGIERAIDKSGTYWVIYQEGSCSHFIDTFKVEALELNPIINVEEFDLSTTEPYSSYQWLLNGNIIHGANDRKYTVLENGDYAVVVENQQGCSDTSDIYTVDNVTGINKAGLLTKSIHVYPNPTYNILYIKAPLEVNVVVSNIEGKVVLLQENAEEIQLYDLIEGVYFIQITDKNNNLIKAAKFVKLK